MSDNTTPTSRFFSRLLEKRDNPILIIDGQSISHAEFMTYIVLRHRQLISCTSKATQHIPVVSYRGWRYWVDIFALWAANKVPVPIDPLMPKKNIQYILDLIHAEFSLGDTHTNLPTLDEITPNQTTTDLVPCFSIQEDSIAAILFTSGSTGLPKGVVLKFKTLMGNTAATVEHLKMNRNRLAISIPFHFVSAISHFFATLLSASTLIASESKCLPAQLIALVNQSKADCFGGSPLQLEWLAKSSIHIKTNLQWMMSSGDHLSIATIHLLQTHFQDTLIHTCYGLTEVGGRCCFLNPSALNRHAGSVGKSISGLTIKVLDETGVHAKPNQVGEIFVEGDYLLEYYFNNPEINTKGFLTGDLGYLDAEGFLYLTGRQDDVFKVNGQKVSVIPIQQQILALGKVRDAAVVPYQHTLLGKVPVAFYVSKSEQPLDVKALMLSLRNTLPGNHLPQRFIELDAIPRTGSGKIKRAELKTYLENIK
jgi:long-chain acyl-CoA synthetase